VRLIFLGVLRGYVAVAQSWNCGHWACRSV